MTAETVKPILYVDVDGVLLRWPQFSDEAERKRYYSTHPRGGPPDGAAGFLTWARATFECRWLSAWTAASGSMGDDAICRIADSIMIDPDLLRGMDNPRGWEHSKTEGIDWDAHEAGRSWFWIDDDAHLIEREVSVLRGRGCRRRLITTDSSVHPDALFMARARIERRMGQGL